MRKVFLSKAVALVISMIMLVMAFTSCTQGQKSNENQVNDTNQVQEQKTSSSVSEEKPPVVFTMNMQTPVKVPPDFNEAYSLKLIKEKFNVEFKIELYPADLAQFTQKLNLMAASNSLPDIINTWNNIEITREFAEEGFLYEIPDEMIKKYCPNVIKAVPATAFEKFKIDGKNYGIPGAINPNYISIYARGDWMEKLGIKDPVTLEDFEEMLRSFTFKDPDGNGKDDTYGYGERNVWGSTFAPIFGAYGIIPFYWTEYNGGVVLGLTHPKAIEVLAKLQSWYKEGLIDKEWITTSTDDWFSKIGTGKVGFAVAGITTHQKLNDLVTSNNKDGYMKKIPFPKGPTGKGGIQTYGDSVLGNVFSKNIKNIERLLEVLDYGTTEEGLSLFMYGEEGKHYKIKDTGGAEMLISPEEQVRLGIGNGNQPFFSPSAISWNFVDKFVDKEVLTGYKLSEGNLIFDALYKSTKKLEAGQKYPNINDILLRGVFEVVLGKETPENYKKFVDEWYAKGGKEITEEASQAYKEMLK